MDKVSRWIDAALVKENLQTYKLNIYKSSGKGEGFIGDITFVRVDATTKSGQPKVYELLVKATGRYSEEAKPPMFEVVFEREMFFYNKVAPAFLKFELERKIAKPFNAIPKCFLTQNIDGYDMIIMNNLNAEGFEMHSLSEQMSWKHIELLAERYGHFHAVSMALKDQKPEEFQELSGQVSDIFKEMMEQGMIKMFNSIQEQNLEVLTRYKVFDARDKLTVLNEGMAQFLSKTDHSLNRNAVLTHGDCWCNNFMFKYLDDKQQDPEDAVILDWQVIRLASPALDVAYFFYCAVRIEELHRHEEFLDLYYEAFTRHLKALGSDPEKLYPRAELQKDWEFYGMIGLIFATVVYRRACTSNEGIAKEEDIKEFAEMTDFRVGDEDRLVKMLVGLVNHMAERGVIKK